MDEDVVDGRYARLELGSATGRPRVVTVGFVDDGDGSLLVAGGADARWAASLAADGDVIVTIGERRFPARATVLDEDDRARGRAIRELILRYGTPSERLGRGPVFRLTPRPDADGR